MSEPGDAGWELRLQAAAVELVVEILLLVLGQGMAWLMGDGLADQVLATLGFWLLLTLVLRAGILVHWATTPGLLAVGLRYRAQRDDLPPLSGLLARSFLPVLLFAAMLGTTALAHLPAWGHALAMLPLVWPWPGLERRFALELVAL